MEPPLQPGPGSLRAPRPPPWSVLLEALLPRSTVSSAEIRKIQKEIEDLKVDKKIMAALVAQIEFTAAKAKAKVKGLVSPQGLHAVRFASLGLSTTAEIGIKT